MVELLNYLNTESYRDHQRRFANILRNGDPSYYLVEQIQEKEKCGWTKVYRNHYLTAIINWQACGITVYSLGREFIEDLESSSEIESLAPSFELVKSFELEDIERGIDNRCA